MLLLTAALVCTSCTSCVVVERYGRVPEETATVTEDAPVYPDRMRLDARIEFASHVAMVRVTGVDDIDIRQIRRIGEEEAQTVLEFRYHVEVLDVLMDIPGTLQAGMQTVIVSNSGMLLAGEALDILEHKPEREEYGVLPAEAYAENEYIVSTDYDTPPIEVGKTYLVLLQWDEYSTPTLTDVGCDYLWECDGERVYHTRARKRHELTTDALLASVQAMIDSRTGIFAQYRFGKDFDEALAKQQMAADARSEGKDPTKQPTP